MAIGFDALNAHSIHHADLSGTFRCDRPGHGAIPAAYVSMIGVDSRDQRRGYGDYASGYVLGDLDQGEVAADLGLRGQVKATTDAGEVTLGTRAG